MKNAQKTVCVSVIMATALVLVSTVSVKAHTNWCPVGPYNPNPGDVYPGTGWYPSGPVEDFPWWVPPEQQFGTETFAGYAHNEVIDAPPAIQQPRSHLVVTSGTLTAKHIHYDAQGNPVDWRRAFSSDYNFRMLVRNDSSNSPVKWTDGTVEARVYVDAWQPTNESWQGVHLFARYRSDDDNYVVSLRRDNTVVIKRERCHSYVDLATGAFVGAGGVPRVFETKRWYTLAFQVEGNILRFYIDNVLQLQATDGTFSWGTFGLRSDYANLYIDYLFVY